MTADLTLTEWLEQTAELRSTLEQYGKTGIPTDQGERHVDMDAAIQNADDAGRLRADAENLLTQHYAQAVMKWCKERDKFTADERRRLINDEVRDIQRLVDGLSVTERTIKNRIYALMNQNRSR